MAGIKRVTMQDIADACGLSRNTVSKIFNGRGSVPEVTRELVLSKAQELGYYQFGEPDAAPSSPKTTRGNIALLTHSKPLNHNFGSRFITNFTDQICRSGFNLKMFEISEDEYREKRLPPHFVRSDISGILAFELFDRDYTQMVCDLELPTLFLDSYAGAPGELMRCDLVYMENYASAIALTQRQIQAGAQEIGFVGDISHCSSFRERWNGYRAALEDGGLPVRRELCILADDSEPYGDVDWVAEQLNAMPRIPDGFVCANDFLAIRIMQALRKQGLSVPEDVMITGFDGSPEASVITPSLTTAEIPSAAIGRLSADMLLERIATPTLPYRCSFVKTTPIWRDSVRQPI
ncbi:MAG TPA: LacI family DNA-binding transcriptional regulator [Candidatus Flavonifractor merdigallinarum]|uniref:LacI family DNA-binding transcriptional regulator n=1 Tax=Candidatus Flavonifractor merdigallinarum TaxID=2838589 RepID=A0A9D1YAF9_9FIRM|nr:LacI family DNA-binding transcriptional regulator [Candidatus Flavonifractor merdigallinarum]